MPDDSLPDGLCDALEECATQIALSPEDATRIKREFYEVMKSRYGKRGGKLALNVITIAQVRGHVTNIFSSEVTMNNKSAGGDINEVHQQAGGDMTGVVGGVHSTVEMRDVTSYNQMIDQSGSINAELRDALKEGRREIESLSLAEDVKQHVLDLYGKLTAELKKTQPKASILEMLWSGISTVGKAAPALILVGKLLGKYFGISG